MTFENLTKAQQSVLLYAESCMVDRSGLLEGIRMNQEDLDALKALQAEGVLTYGRIPSVLLEPPNRMGGATHWVSFTDAAWEFAHTLRRERGTRVSQKRLDIDALVAERLNV